MRFFSIQNLYILLILTLSFGSLVSISPYPGIRLYTYDFPAIILASYAMLFLGGVFKKYFQNIKYLLLFLLIGFSGLIFSVHSVQEFISASAYFLRLILYLLVLIPLLFSENLKVKNLLKAIAASGLIFLCIGYIQYFFYPDLANLYYLGWDRHLFRFFSTFLDPNFAGAYLLILFLIAFSFSFLFKGRRKLIYIFLSFLFIPAILLTYSRSTYISAFFACIFFFSFFSKRYVIAGLIIFIFGILLLPKNMGGEGVNLLRTASVLQRSETFENAVTIFIRHPVVGVGFNDYRFAAVREGILDTQNAQTSHAANGVSNSYLFILATTGLLGFSVFILVGFNMLKTIYKLRFKTRTFAIFSRAVFASFIGILIHSLFDNTLFYAPVMILLILLYGMVLRSSWED